MSTIVKPFTFSAGATIIASEHNSNFDTLYTDYNGNITNVNIASNASIADTKLAQITSTNKVSGSSLTDLASIPSGAGLLSATNINVGTGANQIVQLNGSAKIANVNLSLGTGANEIVQLDSSSKLPAVDGSQLTNIGAKGMVYCWNGGDGVAVFSASNYVTTTVVYDYLMGDNSGTYKTVLNTKYKHSSAFTTLTTWCQIWQTSSGANRYAMCQLDINSGGITASATGTTNQVTPEWVSFNTTVSSLTNNTTYDMKVQLNQAGSGGAVTPFIIAVIIFSS